MIRTTEGRVIATVRQQTIVLSQIASAILEHVPEHGTAQMEDLTLAVVRQFGKPAPPQDAADLVRIHVLDLVAHGVLSSSVSTAADFTPEGVAALRDAVRHVVSGAQERWRLPGAVTGSEFLAAAERHRVVPFLAAAAPVLDLPDITAAEIRAIAAQDAASVSLLAAELATITAAFDRIRVRVLALKGLALAVQAHGTVSGRGTGDHDLLVDPGDLERACGALAELGWTLDDAVPRPGDSWPWRRMKRDANELTMVKGGSIVDLHWSPGPVRGALPEFDVLWARRTSVPVGGHTVQTLGPYDALAHSASHTAKDHWRWLRGLLDVRLLMETPAVWHACDRPLRHDQLLSIGIATTMFGAPRGAPAVVHQAEQLASGLMPTAVSRQAGPSHVQVSSRIPGGGLIAAVVALQRAGASPADLLRQLSTSFVPIAYTADISDSTAWGAIPPLVARRMVEIGELWSRAVDRRRMGRQHGPTPRLAKSTSNATGLS